MLLRGVHSNNARALKTGTGASPLPSISDRAIDPKTEVTSHTKW